MSEYVTFNRSSSHKYNENFEVPETTLQRLSKIELDYREAAKTKLRRKTVLDQDIEEEFITYTLVMQTQFCGLG